MNDESRKKVCAETRLQHSAAVAWQRLGDEVVVLDMEQRTLVGLDGAATALWEALSEERSVANALKAVAERLQQPVAALEGDVLAIAQELVRRQLLALGPAPSKRASDEAADASAQGPLPMAGIAWEERLEDSGVYAACAKDPFGELGPACPSSPFSISS